MRGPQGTPAGLPCAEPGRGHAGAACAWAPTYRPGREVEVREGVQFQEEGIHHLLNFHVLRVFLFCCFLLRKKVRHHETTVQLHASQNKALAIEGGPTPPPHGFCPKGTFGAESQWGHHDGDYDGLSPARSSSAPCTLGAAAAASAHIRNLHLNSLLLRASCPHRGVSLRKEDGEAVRTGTPGRRQ